MGPHPAQQASRVCLPRSRQGPPEAGLRSRDLWGGVHSEGREAVGRGPPEDAAAAAGLPQPDPGELCSVLGATELAAPLPGR